MQSEIAIIGGCSILAVGIIGGCSILAGSIDDLCRLLKNLNIVVKHVHTEEGGAS